MEGKYGKGGKLTSFYYREKCPKVLYNILYLSTSIQNINLVSVELQRQEILPTAPYCQETNIIIKKI